MKRQGKGRGRLTGTGGEKYATCICRSGIVDQLFGFVVEGTEKLMTVSLKALVTTLRGAAGVLGGLEALGVQGIPQEAVDRFVSILRGWRREEFWQKGYEQASLAAHIIAVCAGAGEQKNELGGWGILEILVEIVWEIGDRSKKKTEERFYSTKLLDAALQALSSLSHKQDMYGSQIAASYRQPGSNINEGYPMISKLLKLVKDVETPIRLGASGCLANMYRSGAIPKRYINELEYTVIPILVRLLDEEERVRERALAILGRTRKKWVG